MDIVNEVVILFVIMAVGFVARRQNMIDGALNRGLADLLLNVTMPLMILGAFNIKLDPAALFMAGQIFVFSSMIHLGMFFAGKFIYRNFADDTQKVLRFTAVFSNCAFMGYPVLQSIYGKEGVFFASIYVVPFIIALWTIGVAVFNGQQQNSQNAWLKVMINPGILAVAVGMVMFFSGLKFPQPLEHAFDLLGATTTPLAMILIGSTLSEIPFKALLGGNAVYIAAFVRLIAIPLIVFGVLILLRIKGVVLGVCVVSAAMPAAANTAAFAENFGSDAKFASRCVFVSTLLSIVTVPGMISLVQYFSAR